MDVTEYALQALGERGFKPDAAQRVSIARLQRAFDEWVAYKSRRSTAVRRMLIHPELPRGVYLWGGVGRGKSFLMDAFYVTVPVVRKTRLHFHEFMREVQRELAILQGTQDPLQELSRRIARRFRLICFDEFHISDVTDAMILHRLLQGLFDDGVMLMATSNFEPDALYPDGLHRDRILPAIDLIKKNMDVQHMDGGRDYRHRAMRAMSLYHMPLGPAADTAMEQTFECLAEAAEDDPTLHIEFRELIALRRAGGVIWFDFESLCNTPRSQNDYLEIAARFHTVLVSDVPRMTPERASAARRFTLLVDVLYDRNIKLVLSAEVNPAALYPSGPLAYEFERTVSRLLEMQTSAYLAKGRREVQTALT
ncbi:cell division protein ZapE [Thiomonas sp. FB-Cd]|uniref:cell division protein ZapE n=1 Tax=Thiomonas sp. FB-Cd TaxID=1158292 RepID=UPI0004DEFDFF|nr:cell division protein ZapE [Thiomonas sp. FB-Cd]